jgi:NAD(P)-dependent dehydrogenase (short-subunit alcohol dehydrogenase family)
VPPDADASILRAADTAAHAVTAALAPTADSTASRSPPASWPCGRVCDLPDDALADLFLINALAPIRLLRSALPHLASPRADGRGPFVVNLGAVVGRGADRSGTGRRTRSPPRGHPADRCPAAAHPGPDRRTVR